MKYIWILKYILYCSFSRRNLAAAYQEGGALGFLLVIPYGSFCLVFNGFTKEVNYIVVAAIVIFDIIITWDIEKVWEKYHYFDLNKHTMTRDFSIVRWAIFIDIVVFILSLAYNGLVIQG